MAKQVKRKPGKRAAKKSAGPTKTARAKAPAGAAQASWMNADWINNALSAPMVREAIAAAIVAGAGAAAAVFVKRHGPSASKVRSAAADASSATKDLTDAAFGALAGAAAETMKGMLPSTGEGRTSSTQRRTKPQDQDSQ